MISTDTIVRRIRTALALGVAALVSNGALAAATTYIDTAKQKESGFTNHLLTPFQIDSNNTTAGNYVQAFTVNGEPAVKTYWHQSSYNGTRATKGAEVMSPYDLKFWSEGWYGFRFMIPTGFPAAKELAIAQIFSRGRCKSWSALLVIKKDNLVLRSRNGNGCGASTDRPILAGIPRNAWQSVVIRFKISQKNAGELKLWFGNAAEDSPKIDIQNIDFGDGYWAGDSLDPKIDNNYIDLKFGQYNFDTANYTPGEFRVVYFDDVSMLIGNPPGAFDLVNPK